MAFDRMGRRIEMRTVKDGEETLQRFIYDNYLCSQQLRGIDNALFQSYVWDPTEPIATRPLVFLPASGEIAYYFHDGNKNVTDLVSLSGDVAHYDYAPFGDRISLGTSENVICFSSEFYDNTLRLVYYNYRYYDTGSGRWLAYDKLEERDFPNMYMFADNIPSSRWDTLGLACCGTEEYNPLLRCCVESNGRHVTYSRWTKKRQDSKNVVDVDVGEYQAYCNTLGWKGIPVLSQRVALDSARQEDHAPTQKMVRFPPRTQTMRTKTERGLVLFSGLINGVRTLN